MLKSILSAINFVDWFSFLHIGVTAQGETMPLSEWCAQFSCVETNFVMTLAGLFSIILLLIKRNKKWWWYTFFTIFTITSITSVGMHTANYGEFQSGVFTTKLLGSYIDMTFCLLIAWAGVCCFIFEFCDPRNKKPFALAISCWTLLTIITLSIEVFIFKDRPLFILGGGSPMNGTSGGFSIGEISCFLIALPLIPIVIFKARSIDKIELSFIIFVISIFFVGFLVSNIYGDNQINSLLFGNLHTHSLYHILNGMGTYTLVYWIDYRTQKQLAEKKELESKLKENPNIMTETSTDKVLDKKKDIHSWAICTGISYSYILLSIIASISAFVKGSRGDYAQYSFDKFQYLLISSILFVGLTIIGVFITIKMIKVWKAYKEYKLIN